MKENNGYGYDDMKQFDIWGRQPKQPVQTMSKQERAQKFSEYRWKLAQKQKGGNDTVPTNLYPQYHRQNAIVEKARQGVTLKESTQWRESQGSSSWKDASWKKSTSWQDESSWKDSRAWQTSSSVKKEQPEEEPNYKETPGSSSTSWQQSSWQGREWQTSQGSHSQKPKAEAPWKLEENQWKRRKW